MNVHYIPRPNALTDDWQFHKTTHTPAPVATAPPDCDLDTSVAGRLTFHFIVKGCNRTTFLPFCPS
jgi:hypothetical protein